MITRIFKKNKLKKSTNFVAPDEIFLDSTNLQNFDLQQFEGRIEKPISKRTIIFVGLFFIVVIISFTVRLGYLQIQKGEAYYTRSQNNTLNKQIIFADRGIIYDRNKKELAWNKKIEDNPAATSPIGTVFPIRSYLSGGFSHLLGYISYPAQDKSGNYWQPEFVGKNGLEKEYGDKLKGTNGSKIIETDALGKIKSENIVNAPKRGEDLTTTVDSRIQKELFSLIKSSSERNNSFTGGSGAIMNIQNGEVLTLTSYPEYDSEVLSLGKDSKTINSYSTDKRKVFLDRAISGLYTPGSIVKPFLALGALAEGIIDPYKKILSTGSISIPNPYFPDQNTVFKDWKAHGWTDMRQSIAVSSDVYFYTIGGGFGGQKGLGIVNIEKYSRLFGIGEMTGIDLPNEKDGTIPNPEWKIKNFAGDPWRIGDTYHTAIGQYGFQVTPVQMVKATAAIANNGSLVTPHILLNDTTKILTTTKKIDVKSDDFTVVREGMREAVTDGTAVSLNVPYVKIGAKTGTAQIGLLKNKVNSWVIGFFPYDNPQYAFAIIMEKGPVTNTTGGVYVMRQILDWMHANKPEYLK